MPDDENAATAVREEESRERARVARLASRASSRAGEAAAAAGPGLAARRRRGRGAAARGRRRGNRGRARRAGRAPASACTTRSAASARRRSASSRTERSSSRAPTRSRSTRRALDVRAASSRGLGELIARAGPCERLLVCLGGTATMDAGAGLLEVLDELPAPTTVLCDTRATLVEAPRLFGPQKGALADDVAELESALRATTRSRSPSSRAAARRAGSARRWPRSARSSSPARTTCSRRSASASGPRGPTWSSPARARSTARPSRARRRARPSARARELGVRCLLFGGRVEDGVEALALERRPRSCARRSGGARVRSASAARSRFAIAWSSGQAMRASLSTSGRKSQKVRL